jgi:LEA14-like dessication related protein
MRGRHLAPIAAIAVFSACSKPAPPTLAVKAVKVTDVSMSGIGLDVTADVTNPNAVTLSARRVTATIVIEKKYPLGTVAVDRAVSLPPNSTTPLEAPTTAAWQDLGALTALAGQPGPVHFEVDGTVNVGGDRLNVDLPFKATGEITHDQLVRAVAKSIPSIPGLR